MTELENQTPAAARLRTSWAGPAGRRALVAELERFRHRLAELEPMPAPPVGHLVARAETSDA